MLNKLLAVIVLAVFAAGCGVKAETYVMTKERVDQHRDGNNGCLSGECTPAPTPEKTTRKVYVLEVSKPVGETKGKQVEEMVSVSSGAHEEVGDEKKSAGANKGIVSKQRPAIVIPPIDDEPAAEVKANVSESPAQGPSEDQQYTVLKDDTLQKIAKKVYGSYSKWIKIYDANKEKIKDPNLVKPGTVLTLPAVDSGKKN